MWMTDYVKAVKRKLRDQYGFVPREGSSAEDPCFDDIPDGDYPMEIEGQLDDVKIVDGKFHLCNVVDRPS